MIEAVISGRLAREAERDRQQQREPREGRTQAVPEAGWLERQPDHVRTGRDDHPHEITVSPDDV
jgi:hypothetical protein